MKITFVTLLYPSKNNPHKGTFVKNIIEEITKYFSKVEVLHLQNIFRLHLFDKGDSYVKRLIYFPIVKFNSTFLYSLDRKIKQYQIFIQSYFVIKRTKPDIIYSHFLVSAQIGHVISKFHKINHVIALGENDIYLKEILNKYSQDENRRILLNASLIITVSKTNQKIVEQYLGSKFKHPNLITIPNAVDNLNFYAEDKTKLREKWKFKKDIFIISFIGHFNERKGAYRVLKAIEDLPDNVFAIFMGEGGLLPESKKIIYKGKANKTEVAELLNCSDCFVLPTQAEGSCNAINEAMACGLPIISSNISSIREQVSSESALLINPDSIPEIKIAIEKLYHNKATRKKMAEAAYNHVKDRTMVNRAKEIFYQIKQLDE